MNTTEYLDSLEDNVVFTKEQFNQTIREKKSDRFDGNGEYRYNGKIKNKQKYKREKFKLND